MLHAAIRFAIFALMLFLLVATSNCANLAPKNPSIRSFYYWKTTQDYNDTMTMPTLKNWQVQHFYIRYFDVRWSEGYGMPIPDAPLSNYGNNYLYLYPFTPVIFITNSTFEQLNDSTSQVLATKIATKIQDMTKGFEKDWHYELDDMEDNSFLKQHFDDSTLAKIQKRYDNLYESIAEIQIDCDWTEGTRKQYFTFLKQFKKQIGNKKLSVTVRLYPYKYRTKMGVPPADRAMLMCYNTGQIQNPETHNSIFDAQTINQYFNTKTANYPLPMDIGLPVFEWGVWFTGETCRGILHDMRQENLEKDNHWKRETDNTFRLQIDTVIGSNYMREGDLVRCENTWNANWQSVIDKLHEQIPIDSTRIALYHWDMDRILPHEKTILNIYKQFE